MVVVLADEAAVAHVDQLRLHGRFAVAAGHREQAFVRRAVAAQRHGAGLVQRDEQQFVLVRHDHVAVQQVAELAAFQRAGADLGHRSGGKAFDQEGQQILVRRQGRHFCGTARDVGQTAGAWHQAHADFDQTDIAFHVHHAACRMHGQLAATAQRQTAHGRHHRHVGVADLEHDALQLGLGFVNGGGATHHEAGQHGLQVGAGAERFVARPNHQGLVIALGQVNRLRQAFGHVRADGVHLGLDAGDQDLLVQRPQPDRAVLVQRGAGLGKVRRLAAQHGLGEMLAGIDRQFALGHELAAARVPGTGGRVHAASLGHRALEHPVRQRRLAQRLAGGDVFLHHVGHFQPAGFLPQLERALLHAKAPAHRQVQVARGVGDVGQVDGRVMEGVAQNGPQELALRALGVAQQLEAFGSRLFQHAGVDLVGLLPGRHVVLRFQFKAQHVAPDLLEESGLGLLAQVAHFQQGLQNVGRAKAGIERVGLQAQVVLQGLDDMGQGVQTHNIRRTESAGAGATELLAGQIVNHVITQAKVLDLLHRRQHAGDADAVGDEVGRVVRAHHALAQAGGDKAFELIEHLRLGGRRVDQLDQVHVAWRIEEVDAAKARFERIRQRLAELGDGQARGVGRDDGVRRHIGRYLAVQVQLPVHALGNGLDDQVAVAQLFQVFVVIGLAYQRGVFGQAQRRRLELFQPFHSARDDAVLWAFLGRQVKQQHRDLDVDQVRGNLRAHHAGAKHGDFFHIETRHEFLSVYCARTQTWVR